MLGAQFICGLPDLKADWNSQNNSLINISLIFNPESTYKIMAPLKSPLVFKRDRVYTIHGSLWIECNGNRYFGPGPAELLSRIDKTGSIRQAAIEMEMSYKKAWEMVSMLNDNSVAPLVIPQTGGTKGGGSVITSEAKTIIAWHNKLRERFLHFLEKESKNLKG